MSAASMSVGLLLNEKEQEVARLREQALTGLESKVLIDCMQCTLMNAWAAGYLRLLQS